MSQKFSLDVNGKVHTIEVDKDMPLLYALRNDLGRSAADAVSAVCRYWQA